MELKISGTVQEIHTYLQGLAVQPLEILEECLELNMAQQEPETPLIANIFAQLKGNESYFLPKGSDNAVTAKTVTLEIISLIPDANESDWSYGINTQVVNHLKRLANDPDSEVAMIDNSVAKGPHLFYVSID